MFSVGSITAKLGLDIKPLSVGFDTAGKIANGFKTKFTSMFSGLGGGIFGALKAGAGGALGVVGQIVTGALRRIGEEIVGIAQSIVGKVSATMESIDAAGKAANQLGISTERFTALAFAAKLAGVEQNEFAQTLKIMENNLADAASGAGTAKTSLDSMGLSARDLTNLPVDEALKKIGDALNGIGNASERNQAAMNIFGKQAGPELLNLLSSGTSGIDQMIDRAKALGVTFNDVDFQKVQAANDALTEAGAVIQGVLQQAVIALAPYIKGIADEFTNAAVSGGGFGRYAIAAVEGVATAVAYVSDFLSLFSAGWNLLKSVVIAAVGGAIKALDLLGSGVVYLLNLLPGAEVQWTDTFSVMADSMAEDAVAAFDAAGEAIDDFANGKNEQAVSKFFDEVRSKSQKSAEAAASGTNNLKGAFKGLGDAAAENAKKIEGAFADVDKQLRQFGMTDLEKQFDDFKHMTGVTKEQVDAFAAKIDQLKKLQAGEVIKDLEKQLNQSGMSEFDKQRDDLKKNKLLNPEELDKALKLVDKLEQASKNKEFDDKVKSFRESIETPLDKFNKQMDFLQDALALGKITSAEFDQGAAKARQDAFGESKLPKLVKAGSAEAFAARFDASNGANSPLVIAKQTLKATEANNSVLRDIRKAVEEDDVAEIVV